MKTGPWIHAVVLGGFAMATAAMLSVADMGTREEIALRKAEDLKASLAQVLPAELYDNDVVGEALVLSDGARDVTVFRATKGGALAGVAYEMIGRGYAGDIRVILGVAPDGTLLGVRTVAHNETPGLGDKIEVAKSPWITRFGGLGLGNPPIERWKVKKDGGEFDQFSGATITPRAVVGAIRDGLVFYDANRARFTEAR
ncbi:MAG: electron transport complex subunit RsxG [Alphaproteobacteria bacterium]|nr:electron transport complex subunit RsxG [Alphaproteobacteria bacterium]